MNSPPVSFVAGEPLDDLVRVLRPFRYAWEDEMLRVEGELEPDGMLVLRRALLRAEAHVLLDAAEGLSADEFHPVKESTLEQRRADAFTELACQIADAVDPRPGGP